MANEWREITVEQACSLVVDCPHSTPVWTESGVVVIRNTYLKNGRMDLSNPSFTDEEHYQDRIRRAAPQAGDLVISREAPIGEIAMIPEGLRACLGQRVVLLRPNDAICDGKFLLYSFIGGELRDEIMSHEGTGSTVSNLRIPSLKAAKVKLPPLPIQRQIAAVLSAFDDKIELNRQMNRTLEQMARALFKSWFVDFDPVRAKMRGEQPEGMDAATAALFPSELVEVDGRAVPKGWEWRGLGKIAENFDSRRKPLSKQQRENFKGPYYYYGAAKPIDSVADFIFDGEYLLLAEDGSVETDDGYPVLQLVNEKFWPNNHTHILSGKPPYANHFLYLGLSNTKIAPYITGAVQKKITQHNMNSIPFLIASVQIHHMFNERIGDLFSKIQQNDQESARLAQLRDALLPRLLSGEVDVSEWATPQEEI